MTKGMRLALLGGAVVVVAGAAAAFFLVQRGDRVTPGVGPYLQEFDACRRILFEIEVRVGSKVEYLPRTEYHQLQGSILTMGGQANVQRSSDYPVIRNNYECQVVGAAIIHSMVAPVTSTGLRRKG